MISVQRWPTTEAGRKAAADRYDAAGIQRRPADDPPAAVMLYFAPSTHGRLR
jgi:hypothetical protein